MNKKRHNCKYCGKIISAIRRYCNDECLSNKKEKDRLDRKIKKLKPNSLSVIDWRRRNKIKAVELKGGQCQVCGYKRCLSSLDFHHVDSTTKAFSIGSDGNTRSWSSVEKELKKCVLLCKNCHYEVHSGIISVSLMERADCRLVGHDC